MKFLKSILARVFALWSLLIFLITMLIMALIVWIIKFIKEPKRVEVFRRISIVWINTYFALTGCSLKKTGSENFKKGENYIVVCNHNSFLDILIITPNIPGANKTIAKAGLARIPLFGLIYKVGSVLVDRKDKNSRRQSFSKMKEVLAAGMHMCIYPEGTRNKTNAPLKEFHDGAFKLALDTKKAIMPAVLFNTKKALPPDKVFYFWPTKMELHFLPPVSATSTDNVDSLKQKVFNLMADHYIKNA